MPRSAAEKRDEHIELVALSDLEEGEAGRVRRLTAAGCTRRNLVALGFLAGVEVSVRRKLRSECLLVLVKGAEVAIGKDVAGGIWVEPKAST